MTAVELFAELTRLGIRLEAHGDRLRYSPRSAVTPDLAKRMNDHKGELLALALSMPIGADIDLSTASTSTQPPKTSDLEGCVDVDAVDTPEVYSDDGWPPGCIDPEGEPLFPPDTMEALRAADVQWADDDATEPASEPLGADGWPPDCIDPNELTPCGECGTLELWQTLAGNWRCMKCDPPTKARQLRELARRIRKRYGEALEMSKHGRKETTRR
jgi:hypothetical protein